ncbi:hypothetical protein BD289DRAFT_178302 [Coniella lustricola]|uniref:Uncharacterized protein n=1 Tax=Coniella lustricola TaxID=2025994 RepID=A0A2T3ADI8_9PEZI|nr:hypothetical protein BD289DRAFT_178302 [Coniella lustricola]
MKHCFLVTSLAPRAMQTTVACICSKVQSASLSSAEQPSSPDGNTACTTSSDPGYIPHVDADQGGRRSPGLDINRILHWQWQQTRSFASVSDSGLSMVTSPPRARLSEMVPNLELTFNHMHLSRSPANTHSVIVADTESSLSLESRATLPSQMSREALDLFAEDATQPLIPRPTQRATEIEALGRRPYIFPQLRPSRLWNHPEENRADLSSAILEPRTREATRAQNNST